MAKGDFDKKYNELLSIHDYRGLAKLLRDTKYDSYEATTQAYNMAERYEEEADVKDKLLGSATDEQKSAYNLISYGPIKPQDGSNMDIYSKRFIDGWNDMANENGIIKINTNINNNDLLEYFIDGSGIKLTDFDKYNITRENNGVISVRTDAPNKIAIYNGIKNMLNGVTKAYEKYNAQPELGQYDPGIEAIIPSNTTTKYEKFLKQPHSEFSPIGIVHPFDDIKNIVEEANKSYTDLMEKQTPYILETVVTGYIGEDDKQLQQAFAQGAMDLKTFKEARAILEEKYNRILQTKSLSQYEVWSMNEDNEGSELLQKLNDNIIKSELDAEINLAMTEGRLHYSHASNGLAYGTMIIIDQKYDKNGKPIDKHPARRFFVKDLFRSEAENNLRQDTQVDAQLKYAKHQSYGHTYRAKDGSIIDNWDASTDSAEYTDEFGNKRVISKVDILDIIDNDVITKRMIDYYRKANLIDKNGHSYTEEGVKVYGTNGIDSDVLFADIRKKSIQVMSAKYGDPNSDYVKIKANKLASTVIKTIFEEI